MIETLATSPLDVAFVISLVGIPIGLAVIHLIATKRQRR